MKSIIISLLSYLVGLITYAVLSHIPSRSNIENGSTLFSIPVVEFRSLSYLTDEFDLTVQTSRVDGVYAIQKTFKNKTNSVQCIRGRDFDKIIAPLLDIKAVKPGVGSKSEAESLAIKSGVDIEPFVVKIFAGDNGSLLAHIPANDAVQLVMNIKRENLEAIASACEAVK